MVEWTDRERNILNAIFSSLDYEDVGPKALSRYAEIRELEVNRRPNRC